MQLLTQWSRKRPADDSNNKESSRKRMRDDSNGRRKSIGTGTGTGTGTGKHRDQEDQDQEYKIRGRSTSTSTAPKDLLNSSFKSASSPVATEPLPSPPIHPDRRANIFDAAVAPSPAPAPAPAPLQNKVDYLPSPLSRSPEHINYINHLNHLNNAEPEEQTSKPIHSTSPPNLRADTVRTLTSLDPRSPDYTPVMTSHSNEKSRDSPSHGPRRPTIDSYRHDSNPPSRQQSDIMAPPASATKSTRSETSTPKVTSPPTNGELEHPQLSTAQPQTPLLDSLNGFAQSIMSAASLTVRRDLTKQLAVGQQKERVRQSKFKSTFLTLIEDAESRFEGVEKVSIGIENQIGLSSEAQSRIAITLATQLQKAEVSDAPPRARERDSLKDDLADMRVDLKTAKKDIDTIRDGSRFKVDLAGLDSDLADMRVDLKAAKKDIDTIHDGGRFKVDLAGLDSDLKAAEKKLDYLNREAVMSDELRNKLRGLATKDELWRLATKDELRPLMTKDELRRITTDEVRKHVTEALVPTEKKLASLTVEDRNLNQKIKGLEAVTHKHHQTAEGKGQEQSSRSDRLDASLNDTQIELSRLELIIQEQNKDSATVKVNLENQDKVLTDLDTYVRRDASNDGPSLNKLVMTNSDQIQLLQQDCEKLNKAVRQSRDLQAASKMESPQVSKVSVNAGTRIEEEVKLIRSDLDAFKPQHENFKMIRHDLDALTADREKVMLIRADLDSLINEEKFKDVGVAESFEEIEQRMNKQHEDLARLQNELRLAKQSQTSQTIPNHPPTPPFANVSTSSHETDHQKLQDLEVGLRRLTKSTQGLELFVNSQQQKFDGLTSDRVVQSMVHQMQQIYPQHPGNLVALVNQTIARQARVDSYLSSNLKDRLVNIETQIAARVGADIKIEEITQFTAESRRILLATNHSLKQDIDDLKGAALNDRLQGSSDYGKRIGELADRVTTLEARYVKAIDDFQTKQTDLVRDVTHLQYRNGSDSARNTPGELAVMSRRSKSIGTDRTTVTFENIDDSDGSDTPLSQRSGRGARQDREDGRPSDDILKRKAVDSDDEEGDEGEEIRLMSTKKVPKRRNVSGKPLFS